MIAQIYIGLGAMLVSIALHELGHLLHIKYAMKKEAVLQYRLGGNIEIELPETATEEEHAANAIIGVGLGLVPLIFVPDLYVKIVCVGVYAMGIKHDMQIISKAIIAKQKEGTLFEN